MEAHESDIGAVAIDAAGSPPTPSDDAERRSGARVTPFGSICFKCYEKYDRRRLIGSGIVVCCPHRGVLERI